MLSLVTSNAVNIETRIEMNNKDYLEIRSPEGQTFLIDVKNDRFVIYGCGAKAVVMSEFTKMKGTNGDEEV